MRLGQRGIQIELRKKGLAWQCLVKKTEQSKDKEGHSCSILFNDVSLKPAGTNSFFAALLIQLKRSLLRRTHRKRIVPQFIAVCHKYQPTVSGRPLHKWTHLLTVLVHPTKTKLVRFRPPSSKTKDRSGPDDRPGPFDLLGFTHYWSVYKNATSAISSYKILKIFHDLRTVKISRSLNPQSAQC